MALLAMNSHGQDARALQNGLYRGHRQSRAALFCRDAPADARKGCASIAGGGDRQRYNTAVVKMHIREARPQDVPAIARVHVDSWRTTYGGIVASEFLASLSYEESERMWRKGLASSPRPVSLYLAETPDGAVVGFAAAGPERDGDTTYQGEIYAIYLLQNYQRQGIGRELFRAGARELERRGLTPFLLWVLKANPARHFYQALGGQFLREKEIQIGNERLMEVAYGWADPRTIIED